MMMRDDNDDEGWRWWGISLLTGLEVLHVSVCARGSRTHRLQHAHAGLPVIYTSIILFLLMLNMDGAHAGVLLIMLHMLSQIASGWSCSHLKCFCSYLSVFRWKWLSLAGRALLGLFMNSTSFIMWWSRHLHISSPLHAQGPACLHIRSASRVVGRHSSKPAFQ